MTQRDAEIWHGGNVLSQQLALIAKNHAVIRCSYNRIFPVGFVNRYFVYGGVAVLIIAEIIEPTVFSSSKPDAPMASAPPAETAASGADAETGASSQKPPAPGKTILPPRRSMSSVSTRTGMFVIADAPRGMPEFVWREVDVETSGQGRRGRRNGLLVSREPRARRTPVGPPVRRVARVADPASGRSCDRTGRSRNATVPWLPVACPGCEGAAESAPRPGMDGSPRRGRRRGL